MDNNMKKITRHGETLWLGVLNANNCEKLKILNNNKTAEGIDECKVMHMREKILIRSKPQWTLAVIMWHKNL